MTEAAPAFLRVGLTGGIACGKSTAAAILREAGVPVLDADQVSRDVLAPGTPGLAEVAARWPEAVQGGVLDRKRLGAIVVGDPTARRALEAITHPRIRAAIEGWLAEVEASGAPAAVVEAALLVETGSWRMYDRLLVVSASPDVQKARLMARDGHDDAAASRWLAAQAPLAEKEALASAVLLNNAGNAELRDTVLHTWAALSSLRRPGTHPPPAGSGSGTSSPLPAG